MNIIIPMAGRGERFAKRGYTTPKPLINIGDTPMVIKAVADLPEGERNIFILLKDHVRQGIDSDILMAIPGAEFVVLDHVTEGQASTCLEALPLLKAEDEIMIGACDNGMIFNKSKFLVDKEEADVIVFTFRHNVTVVDKPQQYGWVAVGENNKVTQVSVKKPISSNPLNDHAVIGTFWFKKAGIFKEATERMISQNRRINNEFYVDECINDAIELGYKVYAFEADKYICWGTPDDYETYNYWQSFFADKNIFA